MPMFKKGKHGKILETSRYVLIPITLGLQNSPEGLAMRAWLLF